MLRVKFVSGEELKAERDRRALTQEQVARQLGVATRTLQNWEAGTAEPRARHRRTIAEWYELAEETA